MIKEFKPALAYHVLTPFFDQVVELLGYGSEFKRKVLKLAEIKNGEQVLDVGSGGGVLLAEAGKMVPRSHLVGIDPDGQIVKIAGQRSAKEGMRNVKFIVGFADDLPFTDRSFDVVLSTLTFHHIPTVLKKPALSEIHRVLKPTGRFLLADIGKPTSLASTVLLTIGSIFDGRDNMKVNLEGQLPKFLKDTGFSVQEIAPRHRNVQFLLARKQ